MDRDWMPTTQSIERVSGRSQERTGIFDAETGRQNQRFWHVFNSRDCANQKPETHVFDNSDVLRVSLPRTPRL